MRKRQEKRGIGKVGEGEVVRRVIKLRGSRQSESVDYGLVGIAPADLNDLFERENAHSQMAGNGWDRF